MRQRWLWSVATVSILALLTLVGCGAGGGGAEADLLDEDWEDLTAADLESHEEARKFLRNTKNMVWSENFELDELKRLIDDFYSAGAEQVFFAGIEEIEGRRISAWVVIQLPSEPPARERVFTKYNDVYGQYVYDAGGAKDRGQIYIDIVLD